MTNAGGSNGSNGSNGGNGSRRDPEFDKTFENLEGDTWIQEDEEGESITFGDIVRGFFGLFGGGDNNGERNGGGADDNNGERNGGGADD